MVVLGYACINETLQESKEFKPRAFKKATLEKKGLEYASEVGLHNLKGVLSILKWNLKNNINLYRFSSDLFPFMSEYEIMSLPNFSQIQNEMIKIGNFVRENNMTIEFHPGPYNVLGSKNEKVVKNTIKELSQHGEIFDLMNFPRNHHFSINIHIGTSYDNQKEKAIEEFAKNFQFLPLSVRSRLTIENDDKISMFTVQDLFLLYQKINIPIVFDSLHYSCNHNNFSYEESLKLAVSTWPKDITPLCHHSSSKQLWEEKEMNNPRAHADFLYERFENFNLDLRVVLECKKKEKALLDYRKKF